MDKRIIEDLEAHYGEDRDCSYDSFEVGSVGASVALDGIMQILKTEYDARDEIGCADQYDEGYLAGLMRVMALCKEQRLAIQDYENRDSGNVERE